jgi:hypothetical protein
MSADPTVNEVKMSDAPSSSSPPSVPLSSEGDLLRTMMEMLTQQRDDSMRLREELSSLRHESSALRSDMEANVRKMTRRQSTMLPLQGPSTPLPSPPKVSSMTHSAYTHLRTPASGPKVQGAAGVRPSVGNALSDFSDEDGDMGDDRDDHGVDEDEEEEVKAKASSWQRRGRVDEEKEAAKLAKVMSKRAAPTQFTGEKESEKEGVEQWVVDANDYLDSQFGQLAQ